jgi:Ser/Thr protein kinase RdoA (MazF antagonist)
MTDWDVLAPEELARYGEALAGVAVDGVRTAGQGANSRIVRLETRRGPFALKIYPRRPGDQRDRLDVEWKALRFLSDNGLEQAPRAIARDVARRLMLMEWIEGEIITQHRANDLDDALNFVAGIFAASAKADASAFPLASEACMSASEICRQIDGRLTGFIDYAPLKRKLQDDLHKAYVAAREGVRAELGGVSELPPGERRLIPADFGFHNAIRQLDGRIRYIDFDYFGWDDPVKFVADFLIHPAMNLDDQERSTIVTRLTHILPDPRDAADRLARHLPLYAIRWALILLNSFRADRIASLPSDPAMRLALFERQWTKASSLIERYVIEDRVRA